LVDRGRSLQKNSHTLICSWRSEMKARRTITATLVVLMAASLAWAKEPPVMKMTTEIPPGIATPDRLKTRIGTLNLFDGIPDEATAQIVYDNRPAGRLVIRAADFLS